MGPCPHGDATLVFQHRVATAFLREVEHARKTGQDRLCFVVHGGVVMTVLHRFAKPQTPFYSWPLDNCQGYRCEVRQGPNGLELLDPCHLTTVTL